MGKAVRSTDWDLALMVAIQGTIGRFLPGRTLGVYGWLSSLPPINRAIRWYQETVLANDCDAYLLSFPKCGRTWLTLMLGEIVITYGEYAAVQAEDLAILLSPPHGSIPSIAVTHDDNPHWKTPEQLVADKRKYKGRKVILLVRDPRDVLVSNYFQKTRRDLEYAGDLSSYVRSRRGSLDTLIAWYNIWANQREVPAAFLLVRYEDLHRDPRAALRMVLNFLAIHDAPDSLIEHAVIRTSFARLRAMEATRAFRSPRLRPANVFDVESYKFRRGEVGSFREYLKPDDVDYIDRRIRAGLSPTYGYTP